jgi:hypothetical protein
MVRKAEQEVNSQGGKSGAVEVRESLTPCDHVFGFANCLIHTCEHFSYPPYWFRGDRGQSRNLHILFLNLRAIELDAWCPLRAFLAMAHI